MTFWIIFIITVAIIFYGLFYITSKFLKWAMQECNKNIVAYKILQQVRKEKENPIYIHKNSGRMNKRKYQEKVRVIEQNVVSQHNGQMGNWLLLGYMAYMFSDRQSTMRQFTETTGLHSFSDELMRNKNDAMYDNVSCDFITHKTFQGQYSRVPDTNHLGGVGGHHDYVYRADDFVEKSEFENLSYNEPSNCNSIGEEQINTPHWSETQEPHWSEVQRQEQEQRDFHEQQWSWQNDNAISSSWSEPESVSYGGNEQSY